MGLKKYVARLPISNMYRGMVNLPGYLDTYYHGYALFREQSGFTPTEQENA